MIIVTELIGSHFSIPARLLFTLTVNMGQIKYCDLLIGDELSQFIAFQVVVNSGVHCPAQNHISNSVKLHTLL